MKKLMFFAVASMFLFACSGDDEKTPEIDNGNAQITFELTTSSKQDNGAVTRSPIFSQEATNHVTQVNVYAFKSNGTDYMYVKTFNISGWTDGTTFKRYVVADTAKVPAGDYKFLAVGRDATDMYTVTTPDANTTFGAMSASVTAAGNESEIFAGWAETEVMDQGSRVNVEMKRKVAGVLGYFKNVPQSLNGLTVRYLKLTASNTNLQVNLSTGAGLTPAPLPGTYDIMNIDLIGQPVVDGVYTGNDLSSQGVAKVANSQLGGTYLIPVSGVTLTLGLYDASNTVIKTWTVKDSNGGASSFNIAANQFYSLGTKVQAGSTTGGTPDPGDDDSPVDLLTDQNIVVTITPAWDLIHNLIIQ